MTTREPMWYTEDDVKERGLFSRLGFDKHARVNAHVLQDAYNLGRKHAAARRNEIHAMLTGPDVPAFQRERAQQMLLAVQAAINELQDEQRDFQLGPSLPTEPYTVPITSGSPLHQKLTAVMNEHIDNPFILARIGSALMTLQEIEGDEIQVADEPNSNERIDSGPFMQYHEALCQIHEALLFFLGY